MYLLLLYDTTPSVANSAHEVRISKASDITRQKCSRGLQRICAINPEQLRKYPSTAEVAGHVT